MDAFTVEIRAFWASHLRLLIPFDVVTCGALIGGFWMGNHDLGMFAMAATCIGNVVFIIRFVVVRNRIAKKHGVP